MRYLFLIAAIFLIIGILLPHDEQNHKGQDELEEDSIHTKDVGTELVYHLRDSLAQVHATQLEDRIKILEHELDSCHRSSVTY